MEAQPNAAIIVVSGLPRSGTSMMMAMLEAGGVEVFTDAIRTADEDNPKGYYELERVKSLLDQHDKSWLRAARGKAVKIVSPLLGALPADNTYHIIFMQRQLEEVLASQNKMRTRRGDQSEANAAEITLAFRQHLSQIKAWLKQRPYCSLLEVEYRQAMEEPQAQAIRVRDFLARPLDIVQMQGVVDQQLYRNRG